MEFLGYKVLMVAFLACFILNITDSFANANENCAKDIDELFKRDNSKIMKHDILKKFANYQTFKNRILYIFLYVEVGDPQNVTNMPKLKMESPSTFCSRDNFVPSCKNEFSINKIRVNSLVHALEDIFYKLSLKNQDYYFKRYLEQNIIKKIENYSSFQNVCHVPKDFCKLGSDVLCHNEIRTDLRLFDTDNEMDFVNYGQYIMSNTVYSALTFERSKDFVNLYYNSIQKQSVQAMSDFQSFFHTDFYDEDSKKYAEKNNLNLQDKEAFVKHIFYNHNTIAEEKKNGRTINNPIIRYITYVIEHIQLDESKLNSVKSPEHYCYDITNHIIQN